MVDVLRLTRFTRICLKLDDTVETALGLFRETKLNGIPVVDNDHRLIGYFTRSNLYDSLLRGAQLNTPIAEVNYQTRVVCFPHDKRFESLRDVIRWLRTASVSQTPVVDESGRPIGVVTHANAVIALLNEIERLWATLTSVVEAVSIGIAAFDDKGVITMCNSAAAKMLGLEQETIIGRRIEHLLSLPHEAVNIAAGASFGPWQTECNGEELIVSAAPLQGSEETKGGILMLHESTEVERLAAELSSVRRLQQFLRTVLDLAYDGIVVVDQDKNIIYANRRFAELCEKPAEELIGQPVTAFLDQGLGVDKEISRKTEACCIAGRPAIIAYSPIVSEEKLRGAVIKITLSRLDELREVVMQIEALKNKLDYYKDELYKLNGTRYTFESIVARSPFMETLKAYGRQIARGDSTVLILGESGTGKELFAQAIHNASPRAKEPFVKVNCAAIPPELAESELFGYEPGAFTGASKRGKPGKFELADGGTIFLDEIGDMPLAIQAKILRVIQDKEVERVGSTKPRPVDVRVIAATNQDLVRLIEEGKFRRDLYYRLNVVTLAIPPLRDRVEDIDILAEHLIQRLNYKMGSSIKGITKAGLDCLRSHDWPGNVRELENALERAMNTCQSEFLDREHFGFLSNGVASRSPERAKPAEPFFAALDYKSIRDEAEKELILRTIAEVQGNRSAAARKLRMSRSAFYQKLKKYGIE